MMDISFNTQTVLAGISIGLVVFYVIKRRQYRLPPGPRCIPLVGNYSVYNSLEIHKKMTDLSKIYGPVVSLSFGPQTWVVLNNIDVVLEAMVKKKADFAGRPSFASGDLFSDGGKDIIKGTYSPRWKLHRKIAGKALRHYLQGNLLENMIQDNMNKFLDKMAQEKDPFIIANYLDLMVFHQLYTICFGEKRAVDDQELKAFLKLDVEFIEGLAAGVLEDTFPYFKDIFPTAKWTKFKKCVKEVYGIIRTKFLKHVDTFKPGVNRDFTDSLLIARHEAENEGDEAALEKLDDTYLIQTIADILFAGVDTTRMTMDWFVYFMTKHPEIQSKCQEEIDSVVGSDIPSMKNRIDFDLTEACVFETMRMGSVSGLGVPHMTICDSHVAGVDTTRMTMDWFVYFMTKHPEIQSKCQEEIDSVVGSDIPSMKNRIDFDLTEACVFETMRMGSVSGLGVPHMTICDSHVGGYDIPKDTTVLINHWALHHDPNYWKDPDTFDPYRYLDEDGKMKPTRPDSWLPFSAGRRVCLGETVAKPEMLLMCANLLKQFEIRLPDGVKANPKYRMMGFGIELPSEYKIVVKERVQK